MAYYLGMLFVPIAAGVLLWSSTAKLVVPRTLAASLSEIGLGSAQRKQIPYAVAIYEMGSALLLLLVSTTAEPILRAFAAILMALLGFSIIVISVLARASDASRPCGCFGTASRRPMGLSSALFGLFFLATAMCLLFPATSRPDPILAYFGASAVALTTAVFGGRRLIADLMPLRPSIRWSPR